MYYFFLFLISNAISQKYNRYDIHCTGKLVKTAEECAAKGREAPKHSCCLLTLKGEDELVCLAIVDDEDNKKQII